MRFQRARSKRRRRTAVETSVEREAVSIGWNCTSAVVGVETGLRSRRCDGYKTCPFDTMISNLGGVVRCFEDDFEFFCDTDSLELVRMPPTCQHFCTDGVGNTLIYNSRYKFLFNHESPQKDHYVNERWEKGIDHFVMNNFEEFVRRYSRRIGNMRELLTSGKHVTFILTRPETGPEDVSELVRVLRRKYPSLAFDFKFIDFDKRFYHEFLLLMKLNEDDEEVKRLACSSEKIVSLAA